MMSSLSRVKIDWRTEMIRFQHECPCLLCPSAACDTSCYPVFKGICSRLHTSVRNPHLIYSCSSYFSHQTAIQYILSAHLYNDETFLKMNVPKHVLFFEQCCLGGLQMKWKKTNWISPMFCHHILLSNWLCKTWLFHSDLKNIVKFCPTSGIKSQTLGFSHTIMHPIDRMAGDRIFYDYVTERCWILSGEIIRYVLLCFKVGQMFFILLAVIIGAHKDTAQMSWCWLLWQIADINLTCISYVRVFN